MSNDDGQRIEKRVTINKEFESFDAFVHEYVTNVSRSGVFIRSKEPLPVGTEVNLTFTVIMDDIETIEGAGQVVRVQMTRRDGRGVYQVDQVLGRPAWSPADAPRRPLRHSPLTLTPTQAQADRKIAVPSPRTALSSRRAYVLAR